VSRELKTWPTPYGPITQRMIFANLLKDIVRPGKCVYCGSCAATCPTNAVQMLEDAPRILGVCIKCGYCYYACPVTTEEDFKGFDKDIEESIFGLPRSEKFGVYRKIYLVKRVEDPDAFPDEAIAKKILAYGLRKGYWDVVAYSGRDSPVTDGLLNYRVSGWRGRPSIACKPGDMESAKLKLITPGPTILGVRGAVEEYKGAYFHGVEPIRVAVLGPPHHIRSIWRGRFSWAGHTKLLKTIVFMISYFARKFYLPSKLNVILMRNGLSLESIEDIEYKRNSILFKAGDKVVEYRFEDLEEAIHPGISSIKDLTGEYSDLSIGLLDDVEGVVLIARSEEAVSLLDELLGEGVLESLEFDERDLVNKLNKLYEGG